MIARFFFFGRPEYFLSPNLHDIFYQSPKHVRSELDHKNIMQFRLSIFLLIFGKLRKTNCITNQMLLAQIQNRFQNFLQKMNIKVQKLVTPNERKEKLMCRFQ
jgi:hypothetical protein